MIMQIYDFWRNRVYLCKSKKGNNSKKIVFLQIFNKSFLYYKQLILITFGIPIPETFALNYSKHNLIKKNGTPNYDNGRLISIILENEQQYFTYSD